MRTYTLEYYKNGTKQSQDKFVAENDEAARAVAQNLWIGSYSKLYDSGYLYYYDGRYGEMLVNIFRFIESK